MLQIENEVTAHHEDQMIYTEDSDDLDYFVKHKKGMYRYSFYFFF